MNLKTGTLKRFVPFALWLLFCGGMSFWLLTSPVELSFDLQMDRNCILKVYHAPYGKGFADRDHFQVAVTPWKTHHVFSCPHLTRRIRLAPGLIPGNRMTVRNVVLIRNGFMSQKRKVLSPADLQGSFLLAADGDGFKTTGNGAWLDLSPVLLERMHVDIRRLSLLVLIFLLGSFVLLRMKADDWIFLTERSVSVVAKLKKYCCENRCFLIYASFCLLILFGYELFQAPISEDDDWYLLSRFELFENSMPGAYSSHTYHDLTENYIAHGRWALALVIQLFTGFSPVISLCWTLLCLTVVFLILSEKLRLPFEARYLLFPLFVGNPISYEYISFYMTNNFLGMMILIAFLAAVCRSNIRSWSGCFLLILCSAFCLASFQSLIILFPLWFFLCVMSDGLDNPIDYRQVSKNLLKLCAFCILIVLTYFLALKYSHWVFEANWQYLGNLLQKPGSLRELMRFASVLLKKMMLVFSGKFEFAIHGQLLLFLLMSGAILLRMIRKKRNLADILVMAVALAAILILPFALDIATFNTAIPIRSMVSFPLMMAGLCILGWRALDDCPKIRIAAGILIALVSIQYGILINQKAYASKLRYEQDRSIIQSIKDRCYQIPEFASALNDQKKIPLAVVGNLVLTRRKIFPMWNDSMLNCDYEPALVINLHLLGETYFYPVSSAEMKRVFPTAMQMPIWPAPGSVRFENGIMIVKLSEFNTSQCRQYGFPFRAVTRENFAHQVKKLPAGFKKVWSLTPETLDSAQECKVGFSGSRITVKPAGRHSLRTRPIQADPRKIYYLRLGFLDIKKSGYLYLMFPDSARYGAESGTEIEIQPGEKQCILRISGRYLEGPISVILGDFPGREQVFSRFELLECTGQENLLEP